MQKSVKNILINIGNNIKNLRQIQHKSQDQLSSDCDINRSYLSQVESGDRNISIGLICKIAQALNTTFYQIVKKG